MRLKLATSAALVLGVVLVVMWPWVLQQRPRMTSGHRPLRREVDAFQVMFAGYAGACVFSFMAAGCLAALMMRSAREEFSRQAMANIRELVEGSMEDLRSRGKHGPGQ
ncbi:MAG: hypothetical protein ACYC96_07740 [Fimbriimonadaceae bacterium]